MKLVKENLEENINITEGLKIDGHRFDNVKTPDGNILAGPDGILLNHENLISWKIVRSLLKKYAK